MSGPKLRHISVETKAWMRPSISLALGCRYMSASICEIRRKTEKGASMLGYKRIKQASIALLAAACLVLSGCGRDGGSVSLVEAGPAQEQGGGSYVPQTLASEAEIGTIFSAAPAEDGLYVLAAS